MKYRRRQTQTRIWTRIRKNPNPRNLHFWKKSPLSYSFAILYPSWMEENYVTKAINNFVKYINTLMRKPNVSILETWNTKIWQSQPIRIGLRLKKIKIQKPPQYEKKYHAILIKTMNNFVKYISFTYTYYIDKEKSNVWNLNTKIWQNNLK